MSSSITIVTATKTITDCETAIIVPDIALQEAGYIKTFSIKDSGHAKHEYHALAQMAYFQYQDDELQVVEFDSPVVLSRGKEHCQLDGGVMLCRDLTGVLYVLGNGMQNRKKLLEAAYRYCTRWVRLDI